MHPDAYKIRLDIKALEARIEKLEQGIEKLEQGIDPFASERGRGNGHS